MSGEALGWAWRQRVSDPTAKLLLVKLADQANDDGECWPSQRTLAEHVGVAERTVQRHLATLTRDGLIVVEERRRKNGSRASNVYVLQLGDTGVALQGDTGVVYKATRVSPPEGTTSLLEPPNEPLAPQRRNVVWDILVEHFGEPSTRSEHSDFGKTVAEVREALRDSGIDPNALRDPDPIFQTPAEEATRREIGRRVEAMGDFRSHRRLRNQWGELGRRAETPADEVGQAIRDAVDAEREWEVCPCVKPVGDGERVEANPNCPDCGGTGKDGWVS